MIELLEAFRSKKTLGEMWECVFERIAAKVKELDAFVDVINLNKERFQEWLDNDKNVEKVQRAFDEFKIAESKYNEVKRSFQPMEECDRALKNLEEKLNAYNKVTTETGIGRALVLEDYLEQRESDSADSRYPSGSHSLDLEEARKEFEKAESDLKSPENKYALGLWQRITKKLRNWTYPGIKKHTGSEMKKERSSTP